MARVRVKNRNRKPAVPPPTISILSGRLSTVDIGAAVAPIFSRTSSPANHFRKPSGSQSESAGAGHCLPTEGSVPCAAGASCVGIDHHNGADAAPISLDDTAGVSLAVSA
jgi:hypothetical protein